MLSVRLHYQVHIFGGIGYTYVISVNYLRGQSKAVKEIKEEKQEGKENLKQKKKRKRERFCTIKKIN